MRALALVLALLLVVGVGIGVVSPLVVHAEEETVKITIVGNYTLNQLDAMIYNATSGKLEALDTSKISLSADTVKDLAQDNAQAAIILNLSAPVFDVNSNETVVQVFYMDGVYADTLIIAVADVNDTTGAVSNMHYYKISPATGGLAIARLDGDVVAYANGMKFEIPLSGYSNPKIMLMLEDGTGTYLTASQVQLLELRAIRTPPPGYTLLRNHATGETAFTVQATGTVSIWFDESHQGGNDVDLFIFDSSDRDYSNATTQQTWGWLYSHATRVVFADTSPETVSMNAHGSIKFVVKAFQGDPNSVTWSVGLRLGEWQS